MSGHLFRVVWPLDDPDERLVDVIEVAKGDLPDMLFDAGVQQVGPMTFECETTADGFRLVGVCPVEPWTDTVRRFRRRPAHA